MTQEPIDNRKHARYKFAYPVNFDLFQPGVDSRSFSGFLFNISIGGACIQFEDRYGRIDPGLLVGSRVKVDISIPEGEHIYLGAIIHWIRRSPGKSFNILAGLEFRDVLDWQLEHLEKFINIRNKDQKMIWNLWENFVQ